MFNFPNPVNEIVARTVAAFVLFISVIYLATGSLWLLLFLLFGFLVRAASGPRFSPTAWLAIHVIVPMLPFRNKPVAGPPKRFAQAVGLLVVAGSVSVYLAGYQLYASALIGLLTVFSGMECIFGFCAGCYVFGILIRLGLIPESVCTECHVWSSEDTQGTL